MSATLVDAHVHFHRGYRLSSFLEAAWGNLRRLHPDPASDQFAGCLLLAHIPPGDPLGWLRRRSDHLPEVWKLESSGTSDALVLTRQGEPALAIVAGRQLVTQEGLELLALATNQALPDGYSLRDSVRATLEAGGIPVLPWGFGKWSWERGKVMTEFLRGEAAELGVFLGDNGCRPHRGGTPKLFAYGRRQGLRTLAGSDALPLRDHELRVASYGSVVPGTIDWQRPARWIRDRLASLRKSPATFGSCRSLNRFVQDQIKLRIATM